MINSNDAFLACLVANDKADADIIMQYSEISCKLLEENDNIEQMKEINKAQAEKMFRQSGFHKFEEEVVKHLYLNSYTLKSLSLIDITLKILEVVWTATTLN